MQEFHHVYVAMHNAAKSYPNGIVGLGEAIGHRNTRTFTDNLNPYREHHRATLSEFLHVLRETGDITLLRVLASMIGCQVDRIDDEHKLEREAMGTKIAKECAEAIIAAQQNCRNVREEEAIVKEFDEAILALKAARELLIAGRGTR